MTKHDASLSEHAASRIRESILTGRIKPGERLNVDGLARALAISKTPVREAMNMLMVEKLITYKPKLGYSVTAMTLSQYIEAMEIQEALELHIAVKLIKTGANFNFNKLKSINEEIAEAIRSKVKDMRIFHLNEAFHMTIYEECKNLLLLQELRRIWNELLIHRFHMFSSPTFLDLIVEDHAYIMEALRKRDREKIEDAFQSHFKNGIIGVSEGLTGLK